jgi:hypothetical protein
MLVSSECKIQLTNVLDRSSFYSPINAPYPTVDETSKSITLYVVKTNLAVSSIDFPCCLFDESQSS